jgi:hypothetical protein
MVDQAVKELLDLLQKQLSLKMQYRFDLKNLGEVVDKKMIEVNNAREANIKLLEAEYDLLESAGKIISDLRWVLFSHTAEDEIASKVKTAFGRQLRAETFVIYDSAIDGKNLYGKNHKIVIGSMGIGIRERTNARGLFDFADVEHILRNVEIIVPKLKAKKLFQEAQVLEDLKKVVPNVNIFCQDGVRVPVNAQDGQIYFIDNEGYESVVRSVEFTRYGPKICYERKGEDRISTASIEPNRREGYLMFVQLKHLIPKVIPKAQEELKKLKVALGVLDDELEEGIRSEKYRRQIQDVLIKQVDQVLGRWLLLSSL